MKLVNQDISATEAKYEITADNDDLDKYKSAATNKLADSVKIPGFRPGKAPAEMVIKYADPAALQNEFLNYAVNDLYAESQKLINLRIVGEPQISVSKFVPFTTLEITVSVPIIKDIKLPDYHDLKQTKTKATVTKEQLDLNLSELQKRAANLKPVKRPAKNGDLIVIDFEGSDFKTKEKLQPATSQDYRLVLGEGSLIPGFEEKLVGLSEGKSKSFDLTFPKEYQDKSFAGRKVTFKATIKEINSVSLPKLDDDFAKKVGPFKTLEELKTELRRQLEVENDRQATIDLENRVLDTLAEKTEVELSEDLIKSEVDALLDNAKRSSLNRGQTWKGFLASRGETEDEYTKQLRNIAVIRIKGGLAIGEIATKEGITVTDDEIDQSIENLKRQYPDPEMQRQLDEPANKRELGLRLLTEKVLDFLQQNQKKVTKS